jgi:hypothetical protein
MVEPTAEQWVAIDTRILSRDILGALLQIRDVFGVGLSDAKDIHFGRYRRLRDERPDDFACTDEEYWRDVYG